MMNLKIYVENHGKKIITIFILIVLKKEIKENIVFVMKAKKTYIEATPQTEPFRVSYKNVICFQIFQMLYSIKDREDLENLNELALLQDQVKAMR